MYIYTKVSCRVEYFCVIKELKERLKGKAVIWTVCGTLSAALKSVGILYPCILSIHTSMCHNTGHHVILNLYVG